MRRAPSPEGLTVGLCLTALGVVFTLSNLGLVDALPLLRRFWPLSLVSWGVFELLAARAQRMGS